MPTKAERRAAARADREAREAHAAQAAGRRRRLYMLGGAVVVAAAVVGIAIAISSGGGGSKSGGGGSGGTITGAAEVEAELAGIPQSGNTLGQASAPVTITEFADLQCPVCQEFNQDTLSKLIPNEVKAGNVKLIFRNLQTATADEATFRAQASAALAAGKQNRQWHYIELFYRNQGEEGTHYVTDDYLTSIARGAGVPDIAKWNRDRDSSKWDSVLSRTQSEAQALGFTGTPSILVEGPGGRKPFPGATVPTLGQIESGIKSVE
jgi:protein-disulfide isomerase